MNNQSNAIWVWVGVIVLIVIAVIGIWWLSTSPSPFSETTLQGATTTQATTTASSYTTVSQTSSTVASIVANLSGTSEFASLLSSTGVSADIKGAGPYTIFVPTDGAFSVEPPGTISGMSAAQLKRLVEYHIVSGRAIDASSQTSGTIQAFSGDPLNFTDGSNNIPMVDSAIIVEEYKGSNGVVYLINRVLLPPAKQTQ